MCLFNLKKIVPLNLASKGNCVHHKPASVISSLVQQMLNNNFVVAKSFQKLFANFQNKLLRHYPAK